MPAPSIHQYTAGPNIDLGSTEHRLVASEDRAEPDRVLAAILFTDIVGYTSHAAAMGDSRWCNVIDSHNAIARTHIDQHRGRLVRLTGDGVIASFDAPSPAIACGLALQVAVASLGIEIRAGLHVGEVELRDDDIRGIAVHVAQRVQGLAEPGEVFVSETVPRLVAGSGIDFADNGEHELKGVPGTWRLHSAKI